MASQTDQLQILKATLLTACLLCFGFHPALADKRVALVIGNATYQNVPKLGNPLNDGELVSDALKNAGFESVELRRDLKGNAMRRAIRDFSDAAHDADIAIIYFAGHGIEIDGINYLIPVDAALERDIDAFDEAIPLDRLLTVIDPAKRLRLVILDACRDNPFAKSMRRTIAARGGGRGLAKIEPGSPNTLVAFAAKAGSTAEDGNGKNSPFTAALVKYLTRPGLDIRRAFGFARDEVLSATNNRQEPFIYGSLGGEDFPLVPAVTKPATADTTQAVRQDYELAERIGTVEAWDSFLSTYSDGFYAKLAQAQRNKVIAEQARLAAVEQSRQVEEERAKLAAEGARASALAKAAADANSAKDAGIAAEGQKVIEEARIAEAARAQSKAAEEARIAAEKRKDEDRAKAAEVERIRQSQEAKLAEERRLAAENAEAAAEAKATLDRLTQEKARVLAEAAAAETARAKAEAEAKAEEQKALAAKAAEARGRTESAKPDQAVAADTSQPPIGPLATLAPPGGNIGATVPNETIVHALQNELHRVGCGAGPVSKTWDERAQNALHQFNKSVGTKFDVNVASTEALEAVRGKSGRICPLICGHGFKADGDSRVKIVCKDGYELNGDGSCERAAPKKRRHEKPASVASPHRSAPAPERGPVQTEAPASAQRTESLFAKCRSQAMASGVRRGFVALDSCVRNGGKL
jgi:uncharacterized caspase-like protein